MYLNSPAPLRISNGSTVYFGLITILLLDESAVFVALVSLVVFDLLSDLGLSFDTTGYLVTTLSSNSR